MSDYRTTVSVQLDAHRRDYNEIRMIMCTCGWMYPRGEGASDKWAEHLTDAIVEALVIADVSIP